jgi:hypothetical protein
VASYLAGRGITLPVPPTLRYAPALRRMDRTWGPAMVAGIDGPEGELIGVHRTWLDRDAAGVWRRRDRAMLGRAAGGAVRARAGRRDAARRRGRRDLPRWHAGCGDAGLGGAFDLGHGRADPAG